MAYENILFEQRGRVGIITLNRPERLNAWNNEMTADMRDAVEKCNGDSGIGAIVFTGAGRAYCAGLDISAASKRIETGEPTRGSATAGDDNWLAFLARMPKPSIAALNGPAVGVGITHVLPMDIRIASENARIGFFFIKMGLVPELASSYYLPQLVGLGRATEMCLTGRMIEPEEALTAGLVTEVVPMDNLLDRAVELGELVAGQPAAASARIKALLRENATDSDVRTVMLREGNALAACREEPDHKEAIQAFMEKRPPTFGQR